MMQKWTFRNYPIQQSESWNYGIEDPGFICRANITKKKIQEIETKALLNQMYNGSLENFIQAYLAEQKLGASELNAIQNIIINQGR